MASERDILIERVAGAYRERGSSGRITSDPAWHDLDDDGRAEAFDVAVQSRLLEAALDPDGLSSTARRVLDLVARG